MDSLPIPFNRAADVREGALEHLKDVLDFSSAQHQNKYLKLCENWLSKRFGRPVLMTSSGTHALELAAILAEVDAGDEVIVPSYTFSSTANAFALRGARIRYADVDANGNLDLTRLKPLINPRTRVIVPVHYAGNCCDMEVLLAGISAANEKRPDRPILVIEDAAQAFGSHFRGRPLGTFSSLGALSFHHTKNISAGEGGALIINDVRLLERALMIRDKGTDRSKLLAGLIDKYTWRDVGSSYLPSEFACAYLYAQLIVTDRITQRRLSIWGELENALGTWVHAKGWRLIRGLPGTVSNGHLFGIVMDRPEQRTRFIQEMKRLGIGCAFHYIALHTSSYGVRFFDPTYLLPMSEELSDRLVRLPLYPDLSPEEIQRIILATKVVGDSLKHTPAQSASGTSSVRTSVVPSSPGEPSLPLAMIGGLSDFVSFLG